MNYGRCPQERIENFDRMHGASVYDNAWVYFEDGAQRERNHMGVLMEPPADPRQRLQNIAHYHKVGLDKKVREFDELKKLLRENPGSFPDEDKNLARLKQLQEEAREMQGRLRDAQEELRRLTPGYRTPEEEAEYARSIASIEAAKGRYVAALDAIQI